MDLAIHLAPQVQVAATQNAMAPHACGLRPTLNCSSATARSCIFSRRPAGATPRSAQEA